MAALKISKFLTLKLTISVISILSIFIERKNGHKSRLAGKTKKSENFLYFFLIYAPAEMLIIRSIPYQSMSLIVMVTKFKISKQTTNLISIIILRYVLVLCSP